MIASPGFDGSVSEMRPALLRGGTLVTSAGQSDAATLRQLIAERGVTAMFAPTALFHQLAEEDPDCLDQLELLEIAGALLPRQSTGCGARIHNWRCSTPTAPPRPPFGRRNATSPRRTDSTARRCPLVFRCLGMRRCLCWMRWLRPVPVGVVGELYVAGAGVRVGYWAGRG